MWMVGKLLVASPKLRDPNFSKAVVMLLEHGEEGALGVILNRKTDRTVQEVWESIDAEPCDNRMKLNSGGPVPGPLIALHEDEELAEKQVIPGLFVSLKRERLDELVRRDRGRLRIYSGNSGWGGGQLEEEMQVGGWLTAAAKVDDVFSRPNQLWDTVTQQINLNIMLPGVPHDRLPPDSSLN